MLTLPYKLLALAALLAALWWLHESDKGRAVTTAHAAGKAEVQALWNEATVKAQKVALKAEGDARAEETRRTAAQQEIVAHAEQTAAKARADAAAAADSAVRLRQRIATITADAARSRVVSSDPAASSSGAPAEDAIGMLADVLERADRRAGVLAAAADEAHAAGEACERAYESLRPSVSVLTP